MVELFVILLISGTYQQEPATVNKYFKKTYMLVVITYLSLKNNFITWTEMFECLTF